MTDLVTREQELDARTKLLALQEQVGALDQIDLPLEHYFSRGVYARKLIIPKGVVLVGKIHKYTQINILLKGEISIYSGEGGLQRLKAPFIVVSEAGTKRAGYAHEDTEWLTIHGTHETDLEKLEEELIAKSFEDFERFIEQERQLCLGQP